LILIFALYLLMLPCIPCADNKLCNDVNTTEVSIDAYDHDDHQHDDDNCNPFCSCACCGQIIFSNLQLANFNVIKPYQNVELKFFYKNRYVSNAYSGNIWQPPKV
jgi:hypothetical protein